MNKKLKFNYYIEEKEVIRHTFELLRGDEVVCDVSIRRLYDDMVFIETIETKEEFRGRGFAKILLHHAINKFGKCVFIAEALDESIFFWNAIKNCKFSSSEEPYQDLLIYINYSGIKQSEKQILYRLDKIAIYDNESFDKKNYSYNSINRLI